jgi:hypothetical protein
MHLNATHLAAAGVLVAATDPTTREIYFLFGVNSANKLCHFHGWNDIKSEKVSYIDASFSTAAREYAEESLEVVGTEKTILSALIDGASIQIMNQPNCQCYIVNAGEMDQSMRQNILIEYSKQRKNISLLPRQRENKYLVWTTAKEILRGAKCGSNEKISVKVMNELNQEGYLNIRSWLCGWFVSILSTNCEFYRLCNNPGKFNFNFKTLSQYAQ